MFDSLLTILCGIADVVALRADDFGEFLPETSHDFLRIVKTERGLREECQLFGIIHFESVHCLHGIDDDGAVRSFAGGANNFLMVFVADQNDGTVLTGEFQRFKMDLSNQRAGGIDNFQRTRLGFVAGSGRHAMGAENQHRAVRDFIDGFDKNGSAATQLFHNIRVMNNFVVNINRVSVGFQSQFDNIDGAHHSRAKSSGPYS